MIKVKYFLLGLISILLVSYTTNNIQLFKPVKPSSIAVDCFSEHDENLSKKIKSISDKRAINNFILKDMEISTTTSSGWTYVCLYFEKY